MNPPLPPIAETGLRFFGAVTASASHELKNHLAIINENAGLLDDLAQMAGRGRAIDPNRLLKLAADLIAQVRRADATIGAMNRFAHSVDRTIDALDLNALLDLMARLAQRLMAMRKVRLIPPPPQPSVQVHASAYFLMNLIWRVLDATARESEIRMTVESAPDGARIHLDYSDIALDAETVERLGEENSVLSDIVNAESAYDPTNRRLSLTIRNAPSPDTR
ncbi:MAG: hypothetical protein ACOWWM_21320 [Desulfobacterales bacterium]